MTNKLSSCLLAAAALGVLLAAPPALAQVSITAVDTPFTENFDTLANSGTSSTVPAGWAFAESGTAANTTYTAGTGSANTGDTYSFGATSATDRAFGGLLSGSLTSTVGGSFQNNTGVTITALRVAYTGEQWRLGAVGRVDRLDFQYSLDATSLTTGTWTDVNPLDFTAPVTTGTAGARDGNAAANRTALSGLVGSLSIAPGATFWIRWSDFNATSSDDGLAVDDFAITANPTGLLINDVTQVEGNAATSTFSFTVSLLAPAPAGGVTFDIATADNTATVADGDYVLKSLTGQTIPAGQSLYTFDVTVNGDTAIEPTETFFVNVTNVVGTGVVDAQGLGTITNDDFPPTLSINDVSLSEGDAGTTSFQFTVSLSAPAPAGGVTFDIATADGTATVANNDYVASNLTGQTIPAAGNSYSFTVTVNGDPTVEPNETFFVNLTNVVGTGVVVGDAQGQGTIVNDDFVLTPIHSIQGPGGTSPLVGNVITTRGVVTGVKGNGFFIQEPDATADADPLTSEGVFVFTSSAPPAAAVVGNLVQVGATVAEFVPTADPLQPPLTELTGPTVSLLSSGNPLPNAIPLTATFPDPTGTYDQLERIEGMRASVASLTVSAPTQGNLSEANATSTTNGVFYGVVTGVARPFREAGIQAPDPAPGGTIPPIPRFDSNPERIRVDGDGLTGGTAVDVASDAVVTGLVGPVDYTFRTYSILQDPATTLVVTGGKTATAVTTPTNFEFTVASYNMQRFYDDVDDTGGDAVLTTTAYNNRLNKASLAIRNQLKFPDILGVVEMENLTVLQTLANKINADAVANSQPNPLYQPYLVDGNDIGLIDVGFLVKTAIVTGSTPRVSVTAVVQERAGTLFVNPDASTSLLNDRPPLRLTGAVNHPNGASFPLTVIANHLRSLNGIDSTAAGTFGWATEGDRVRAKRQKQAEDLADLVQDRQVADPNERIVLVGDFNAFEVNDGFVDSMDVVKGTPVPDNETVVPGDGVDLVNPDLSYVLETLPAERYSYTFDGNAQTLDHVLVNANMISATSARRGEHARLNADFPETSRNNAASPVRLSDHDPVVAYFEVASFPVELESFSIE